jgi:hypothetical protein
VEFITIEPQPPTGFIISKTGLVAEVSHYTKLQELCGVHCNMLKQNHGDRTVSLLKQDTLRAETGGINGCTS